MGYRTFVVMKYDIECGNQIGESYGQETISEALSKLQEIGDFEFYEYDGEFNQMRSCDISVDFLKVYEEFLKDRDKLIEELDFTEEELDIIDGIYDSIANIEMPEYIQKCGYIKLKSY